MDTYESDHFFTDQESRYYALQKRRYVDLGRRYMRGEVTARDVADALAKPPEYPDRGYIRYLAYPYAGFTRYARLVAVGCWLAQRDGSALRERTHP